MASNSIERFRGKSTAEIMEILSIETAMWGICSNEELVKLRERCAHIAYELTPELMLAVAKESDRSGMHGVAHLWYSAVAETGHRKPFHEFLKRRNDWGALLAQNCDISETLLRRIAKKGLSWKSLEIAVAAFGRLGDAKGLRKVLRLAITGGNVHAANEAARFLGTPLTHKEHRALLAKIANSAIEDAFGYVEHYQIVAEHAEYLMARAISRNLLFSQITMVAARLKVVLNVMHLQAALDNSRDLSDRVEIVQALAAISPAWRDKLAETLSGIREEYLVHGMLQQADELGVKIGKALSRTEVSTVLERLKKLLCYGEDTRFQIKYGEACLIKMQLED